MSHATTLHVTMLHVTCCSPTQAAEGVKEGRREGEATRSPADGVSGDKVWKDGQADRQTGPTRNTFSATC